jgi:hypothetical protein
MKKEGGCEWYQSMGHPVSSLIVHSSYTAIVMILAGTFPLSAGPRGGFFHNFDFETVLPLYQRRQRVGTSRYCYDLYYVLPAILFFCSGKTLIQFRSILSC